MPGLALVDSLLALNNRKGTAKILGFSVIDKKKMIGRTTTSMNMVLAVQIYKCIFNNIPKKKSISTAQKTCSYLAETVEKSIHARKFMPLEHRTEETNGKNG